MSRLLHSLDKTVPQRFRGFRPRLGLVAVLFALALALLAGRAFDLQVLQHESLTKLADRQTRRTIPNRGRRGAIEDRKGRPLAMSVRADSFYAHPSSIERPSQSAYRLARILDLPGDVLEKKLRFRSGFTWVKRQATPAQSEAVRALGIQGIGSTEEYRRVYPFRFTAAPLLGFTGVDTQGLEGLEYAYDSHLRGAQGFKVIERDALGRTVLRGADQNPTGGGSIRLTIDAAIQHITEQELTRAVTRSEAALGIALVLRSETGEILAMAQAPRFNPNDYGSYPKETFFNRAVTSGYEPGSTFKVITAAVALEEGAVKPDTLFFCENGEWQHYDSVIHDTKPHGWLGLDGLMRVSSNICAAKMGLMIPAGVFHENLRRFGLGQRLGLFNAPDGRRLAGEAEGYLPPERKWTPVDHAAISFGHGILVSPLQLATAINAIATGGELLKPLLVLEVRDVKGEVLERGSRTVLRRVLSPATARTVTELMMAATTQEGTGYRASVPGHAVAGKTGTTEVYDIQARGYSKTRHIASFVGFVPALRPALTILVMVEAPRKGRYGGVVAAPVFSRIAKATLPLLGIWPEGQTRKVGRVAAIPRD